MKIMVVRQACCFQDDQIGPLEAEYDVPESCRVDEFLDAVERSAFLQFSSTHAAMRCRIAGRDVGTVFRSNCLVKRKPVFTIDPASPVRDMGAGAQVEFVFQRDLREERSVASQVAEPTAPAPPWRARRTCICILLLLAGLFSVLMVIVG